MAFTLVQSTTDKKYGVGGIPTTVDKGIPALVEGSPIGLLLALTYTN